MKIPAPNPIAAKPSSRLAVALSLVMSFANAAHAAEAPSDAAKTHTLFMGADLTLEQTKVLCPVVDVTGEAFVIKLDGRDVRVPVSVGAAKLRVTPVLKLTESSATIDGFKAERGYTSANDPDLALQRSLIKSAQLNAGASAAANQATAGLHQGDITAPLVQRAAASMPATPEVRRARENADARAAALSSEATRAVLNGPGSGALRVPIGAEGSFDAINVNFEVSATRALARPFVVIEAEYRAADAAPGKLARWLYARALGPVGSTPTKIAVTQGGFPPGFELQSVQLHLYDRGEEIATNVSSKRVALSRTEAYDYVVMDYLGSHRGDTLPAAPAMGHLPADFPAKLQSGQLKSPVYVKVSPTGKPLASFRDPACAKQVEDPYVQSVVANLFFKPALDQGKPIEGVATVDFAKLVL